MISAIAFNTAFTLVLFSLVQAQILAHFGQQFLYVIFFGFLSGISLSGMWLARNKRSIPGYFLTIRLSATLFLLSVIASALILPRLVEYLVALYPHFSEIIIGFIFAPALCLTYFFGSWIFTLLFRDYLRKVHLVGFYGLIGAGSSLIFYVLFLNQLNLYSIVFLISIVAAVPAVFLSVSKLQKKSVYIFVGLLVILGFVCRQENVQKNETHQVNSSIWIQIFNDPESHDANAVITQNQVSEQTSWSSGSKPRTTVLLLLFCSFASLIFLLTAPLTIRIPGIDHTCLFLGYKKWFGCFVLLGLFFSLLPFSFMKSYLLVFKLQSYSIAYAFISFIFAAACGSYFSVYLKKYLNHAFFLLGFYTILASYFYPWIFQNLETVRGIINPVIITLTLFPFGFILGTLFSITLRRISDFNESAVLWMWGVFGGTVILGMQLGSVFSLNGFFATVLVILSVLAFLMTGILAADKPKTN